MGNQVCGPDLGPAHLANNDLAGVAVPGDLPFFLPFWSVLLEGKGQTDAPMCS